MSRLLRFIPLLVLAIFVIAVAWRLGRPAEEEIRSQLIGQPLPAFALEPALPGRAALASSDLASGQPRMINVFASWCVPCIAEAPQLEALQRQGVEIVGIAIRDRPEDVANFLARYGNPYARIGSDKISEVQLAIGSSGVPETFVIDSQGVIRYQHIGDIREEDVPKLLEELEKAK